MAPKTPIMPAPFVDGKRGVINVIVETPRGCRNKFKYDEKLGLYRLHSVLPAGAAFPYDFGFVPHTKAADGDPIDVLLLMDQPAFTGCVVAARLIGVIEAEQKEKRQKRIRNDRLVAVAVDAHDYRDLRTIRDINDHLLQELQHFFVSYNEAKGREFKFLGIRGPKRAQKLLRAAMVPSTH
jgi:inorganic pyrophosphatase